MEDILNIYENNEDLIEQTENTRIPISLSYSRLSDFDRNGPKALIHRTVEESTAMTFGSIVDTLVLPVEGDDLKSNYIISDLERPTATAGRLVDTILSNYTETPSMDEILELCKLSGYWKSFGDESKINAIHNNNVIEYVDEVLNKGDKMIVDTRTYLDARSVADVLKTHSFSKDIFINDLENHNQFLLSFLYKDILFRGAIDKLIIDHENKTIRIIDLKTGKGSWETFQYSFLKFRYYMQLALYTYGVESIKEELNLQDYKVLPFEFLYIGRKEKLPIIFSTEGILEKATNGFEYNGTSYRGINQVIDDIIWHFDANNYHLNRQIIENNGVIPLNL